MTHRVGPKGQVVIPKTMRDALAIHPGDEVEFVLEDRAVKVEPVRPSESLRGRYAGAGLVADLEAEHSAERQR